MYQSLDEPIVAVHVARALVAGRGVGTDVERSLYRLEGRLRSANERLSSPAVREAPGVLASQGPLEIGFVGRRPGFRIEPSMGSADMTYAEQSASAAGE